MQCSNLTLGELLGDLDRLVHIAPKMSSWPAWARSLMIGIFALVSALPPLDRVGHGWAVERVDPRLAGPFLTPRRPVQVAYRAKIDVADLERLGCQSAVARRRAAPSSPLRSSRNCVPFIFYFSSPISTPRLALNCKKEGAAEALLRFAKGGVAGRIIASTTTAMSTPSQPRTAREGRQSCRPWRKA